MEETNEPMTTERLLSLFDGADHVGGPDRDTFVALWERASAVGNNPHALFTWMVNQPNSWAWLRDDDRRRAQERLKAFDDAQRKTKPRKPSPSSVPARDAGRLEKYRRGWSECVYRTSAEAFLIGDSIAEQHERRIKANRRRELVSWIGSGAIVLLSLGWFL